MACIDGQILDELRQYLLRAEEWANPLDLAPPGEWCPISSILEAVEEGRVGLALTRWDDMLYSPNRPELSEQARSWRTP